MSDLRTRWGGREGLRVGTLFSSGVAQSALYLYGVQALGYLVPLVTVPVLAHRLAPEAFGTVAAAQSLGMILSVFVDFGHAVAGVRKVAALRARGESPAVFARAAYGAKLLTTAVVAAGASGWVLVSGQTEQGLLPLIVLYGALQGSVPVWYFQGSERMQIAAVAEVTGRVVGAGLIVGILPVGASPGEALAYVVAGLAVTNAVGGGTLLRRTAGARVQMADVVGSLREGSGMLAYRISVGLYTLANPYFLKLFAGTEQVSRFYVADRIVMTVAMGLVMPVSQALMPRMTALFAQGRSDARSIARWSLAGMTAAGAVAGGGLALAAPLLVAFVGGGRYADAAGLVRLYALMLPLVALSAVLSMQYLVPLRRDTAFVGVSVVGGAVNVAALALLGPSLGAAGMVVAILLAQTTVVGLMALVLTRARAW